MADHFVMPKPPKKPPTPDRVTVYDLDGNAFDKFPVDAAECVAGGGYFYEKQAADGGEQPGIQDSEAVAPKRRGRKPKESET